MNSYNSMKGGSNLPKKRGDKQYKAKFKETTNPNNSIPKKPKRIKGKE